MARLESPRRLCAPAVLGRPRPETGPPMCLRAHRPAGMAQEAFQDPSNKSTKSEAGTGT